MVTNPACPARKCSSKMRRFRPARQYLLLFALGCEISPRSTWSVVRWPCLSCGTSRAAASWRMYKVKSNSFGFVRIQKTESSETDRITGHQLEQISAGSEQAPARPQKEIIKTAIEAAECHGQLSLHPYQAPSFPAGTLPKMCIICSEHIILCKGLCSICYRK
jgi:hypothetical protein